MVVIAYYLEDHPSQWLVIMVRRFDPLKNRIGLMILGNSIQVLPSFLSWSNLLGWNQTQRLKLPSFKICAGEPQSEPE